MGNGSPVDWMHPPCRLITSATHCSCKWLTATSMKKEVSGYKTYYQPCIFIVTLTDMVPRGASNLAARQQTCPPIQRHDPPQHQDPSLHRLHIPPHPAPGVQPGKQTHATRNPTIPCRQDHTHTHAGPDTQSSLTKNASIVRRPMRSSRDRGLSTLPQKPSEPLPAHCYYVGIITLTSSRSSPGTGSCQPDRPNRLKPAPISISPPTFPCCHFFFSFFNLPGGRAIAIQGRGRGVCVSLCLCLSLHVGRRVTCPQCNIRG